MLSSIHPFGERARGQSYIVTAVSFIVGANAGGMLLGSALATLAIGTRAFGWAGAIPALLTLVVAALWDFSRRPVPSYARQVDENWLSRFRGWVYGAGFGFQLGIGFSTYVKTALTYGFVLAAIVLGSPTVAISAGLVFGATRGLSILITAKVDSPEDLRVLFSRLIRSQAAVRSAGALSIIAISGAALVRAI